jgi:hypothetical protein
MSEPANSIETPGGSRVIRAPHTVWWVIALLLAVIATALLVRRDTSVAWAQTPAAVGAKGIYAFTGQLSPNSYGLFMMDVDAGTIWVYEYVAKDNRLRLVAARSWLYDRYLEDFNCAEPTPTQVADLVEEQRQAKEDEGLRQSRMRQAPHPQGAADRSPTP